MRGEGGAVATAVRPKRPAHPLAAARAGEVHGRGLMSFPGDSEIDRARIEALELLLASAKAPLMLSLPATGQRVEFDPGLPAQMLYYLAIGDYETADLEIATEYVHRGDHVLEVGGGIGVTGSALAIASGNPVVVVEPNERLWRSIERNFDLNGCRCTLVRAAAVPSHFDAPTVPLHLLRDYWWSSLRPRDGAQTRAIAAMRLIDLLHEHLPDVVSIDVEGAEADLLGEALPDFVRRLFVEIHTPLLGSKATAALAARIQGMGFRLCDIRAFTWVFCR
jgi:FkbM family methyltransferase